MLIDETWWNWVANFTGFSFITCNFLQESQKSYNSFLEHIWFTICLNYIQIQWEVCGKNDFYWRWVGGWECPDIELYCPVAEKFERYQKFYPYIVILYCFQYFIWILNQSTLDWEKNRVFTEKIRRNIITDFGIFSHIILIKLNWSLWKSTKSCIVMHSISHRSFIEIYPKMKELLNCNYWLFHHVVT